MPERSAYAGLDKDEVEFRVLTQGGQTVEVEAIHTPTGKSSHASVDPEDADDSESLRQRLQRKACRALAAKL